MPRSLGLSRSACGFGFQIAPGGGKMAIKPGVQLSDFLTEELLVVKRWCERGDSLTPCQKMHRQSIRLRFAAEFRKLPAQPISKQTEQLVGVRHGVVAEFGEFRAERPHRAAVEQDFRPVHDENVDEAPDAILTFFPFGIPLL